MRAPGPAGGELLIDRPPAEVFDFVADERNVYDHSVVSAELISGEPIGAGTRFRLRSRSVLGTVPMSVEIVRYERPRLLESRTLARGMEVRASLRFEPEDSGTRLRWRTELRMPGPLRALGPLLRLAGRRRERRVWDALKRRLEVLGGGDSEARIRVDASRPEGH